MRQNYRVSLGFVATLILCALLEPLALLVKYAVDFISIGHSFAKSALLLAFLALLAFGLEHAPKLSVRSLRVFSILLLASHLSSLVQYLWYCHSYELNPMSWSATVEQGVWSLSRPDHIHTAKSCLSFLPSVLALTTDVGHSFGALFPTWIILSQFLGILTLILSCYLACIYILQQRSWGEAASFVLASFVLVKNAVDGGPLTPEVWAAFPLYVFLLKPKWGRFVPVSLTGIYGICLLLFKQGAFEVLIFKWAPALVVLLAPILWQRLGASVIVLLWLTLSAPVLQCQWRPYVKLQPHALSTILYAREPLRAGWNLKIVSPHSLKPIDCDFIVVQDEVKDSASGLYLVSVELQQDSTPYSLCSALELELVRWPISWYPGRVLVEAEVLYLRGTPEATLSSPLIIESRTEEKSDKTSLRLVLRPGVNYGLALSLLGPELSVVSRLELSYPDNEE